MSPRELRPPVPCRGMSHCCCRFSRRQRQGWTCLIGSKIGRPGVCCVVARGPVRLGPAGAREETARDLLRFFLFLTGGREGVGGRGVPQRGMVASQQPAATVWNKSHGRCVVSGSKQIGSNCWGPGFGPSSGSTSTTSAAAAAITQSSSQDMHQAPSRISHLPRFSHPHLTTSRVSPVVHYLVLISPVPLPGSSSPPFPSFRPLLPLLVRRST